MFTGVLTGLGHGFILQGFSAVFKPMASELGLSRAATSAAVGIRSLNLGIMAALTGWLTDKFGPKWVMTVGIVIICSGFVMMANVHSLWAYYVAWGVIIGTGNTLALTIAPDKSLTDWFSAKRGQALAIRFVLISIFSALSLPIITWIVAAYGWRSSCLVWAVLMAATLPLVATIIKQKRPEFYGFRPDGAPTLSTTDACGACEQPSTGKGTVPENENNEEEFSLKYAMRTQAFWVIIAANSTGMVVHTGFNLHCIPFITDTGVDPLVAGSMMGMMVFFSIPSRFLGGMIADRLEKESLKFLLATAFLFQCLGIVIFLMNQGIISIYILLILFGLGNGATRMLQSILFGRYFGRKAFASIAGTSLLFETPGNIFSPIYAGWIFDRTGSYTIAFGLFALLAGFAAILICFVRTPHLPIPKRIENIR